MKARIATGLLGLALTLSAACLVRSAPGPDESGGSGGAGGGGAPALVIQNSSSQAICFVYFSPSSQGTWGDDRLGSSETIGAGATRGWNVPSDNYDVKLEDCNHNVLLDRRGIGVAGDGVLLTVQ
jgi:hypothetical protein